MKHNILRALVVIIATLVATPAVLMAGDENNALQDAISKGGARLAALQQSDGGWDWDAVSGGCGGSCPNLYGVTGLGLLAAYHRTEDASLLQAAIKTGDALVAKFNAALPGDGNPATWADRPYTQNVEFLVELSKVSDIELYKDVARAWYANVIKDFPNPNDRVTNRFGRGNPYKTMRGWDAASDIRAARATGNKDYAAELARRVIARSAEWDFDDTAAANPGGLGDSWGDEWANLYRILSRGSILWALDKLGNKKEFEQTKDAYRNYLLVLQEAGGSWGLGDTQVTAYVAIGLSTVKKGTAEKVVRGAVGKAAGFLLSMQQAAGGFSSWDGTTEEITEVDSEALQALARVHGHLEDD